ncbi:hypothetical protein HAZT_HAZT007492 [Hyalella azteca]|uniref:Translation initiation factor 5A C-terminal domain-containing protein n=1 Tax=Hyalella azteca TaxID=294128 RepID=A0A6A0HB83_HYAAZ|nr:hypothetical protein HAZT_HAZT007492 [Hyalella azteca]
MSEELNAEFETAESGVSNVYPAQCSSLRKNGYVVIKVHLVGIDLFSGKKYEDICPSTHNMDVPVVKRADYQLVDISADNFLSLMQESGDLREDIKIPDGELGTEIRSKFESGEDILCTVLCAMGSEMVIATKPNSGK